MPVYIKKYTGSNYFKSDTVLVDSITINVLPDDSFPIFRFETEDFSGIGTYRGGDFDMAVSLLSPETSLLGDRIKDYFLGTQRNYFYLIIVAIGAQYFAGIAQQSQIFADFTYSEHRNEVKLTCKDALIEWAKRCSTVANNTIGISNGELLTLEEYIPRHFAGITADKVLIELPVGVYNTRLPGNPFTNPAGTWAYGDFYNFITGQENISRWETFKELAKGIGFNFEMYLNPGSELTNYPEFIFKLFFINDILNQTAEQIQIIEHMEFTTASRMEYLFIKYRHITLPEAEYAQGILFNSLNYYDTDANQAGNQLYPACVLQFSGKALSVTDANGNSIISKIRDVDFAELELNQYQYDFSSGGGVGKLYPLNEAQGGGMAYSKIFNSSTGLGAGFDAYDHKPIQRYARLNYKRYLKGLVKAKEFKIVFNENTNIKVWRFININETGLPLGFEQYYISAVRNIDLQNHTAEIEAIKLAN